MAGEGVCIILISADQNMWGRDKTSAIGTGLKLVYIECYNVFDG